MHPLASAIHDAPDDPAGYSVYGDWLLENGDPFGAHCDRTRKGLSTMPEITPAERTCRAIVDEVGKRKLEALGSLVAQLDMNGGKAPALIVAHAARARAKKTTPRRHLALIAVAVGAELAAMGERGGELIDLVLRQCRDENDLDSLAGHAIDFVSVYQHWSKMFADVATLLVRERHVRPADVTKDEERRHRMTMAAAFQHFVVPRLKKTIATHRPRI